MGLELSLIFHSSTDLKLTFEWVIQPMMQANNAQTSYDYVPIRTQRRKMVRLVAKPPKSGVDQCGGGSFELSIHLTHHFGSADLKVFNYPVHMICGKIVSIRTRFPVCMQNRSGTTGRSKMSLPSVGIGLVG